ncbi:unnamed protein product [Diamesa hyperborea]
MKTSFIILLVALCMIAAVMSSPATEELAFSDSVANVNAFDDQNINKKIIKLIKIKKILKVYIRHMGQNIYNVYYRVRDGGEYRIVVKYGSDHIPGSPFHLRI